eukprot:9143612-Pyramimonas_sp.AAC.1
MLRGDALSTAATVSGVEVLGLGSQQSVKLQQNWFSTLRIALLGSTSRAHPIGRSPLQRPSCWPTLKLPCGRSRNQ